MTEYTKPSVKVAIHTVVRMNRSEDRHRRRRSSHSLGEATSFWADIDVSKASRPECKIFTSHANKLDWNANIQLLPRLLNISITEAKSRKTDYVAQRI
jgi:hypothetical protein